MLRSSKISFLSVLVFISLTFLSAFILSSPLASADDAVVDEIEITVPISCNLTGVGMNTHTTSLMNGNYATDVGTTTIKAFCNDNEGFAIYAIGYTDDTDGKTVMTSSALGSEYDIQTGTGTSGNSQWAMKLATQTNPEPTYPISIQNNYNAYHTVPDDYELVAKRTASTDVGSAAIGSTLTSTYQIYASPTQPAGTYIGKVKYTIVHPHTAEVPLAPRPSTPGKISYYPDARGVNDSMGDQSVDSNATEIVLWASNFQRPGYGFAGWSTTYDYSDSNGFLGPNETIEDSTTLAKIQSEGLSLYAYWIPSAGSLQEWDGCSSMNEGDVTALTDLRDNDTYAIAKLADERCWMIENLRLDYDAAHNSDGSLAQGYGGIFAGLAQPETSGFSDSTRANSLYYGGTQSGTATINVGTNYPAYRIPRYRNDNTNTDSNINPNTIVDNMTGIDQNVYSYGNYYSYGAAKATTSNPYDLSSSNNAYTSLCPSGWKLPTGRGFGDFGLLSNSLDGYKDANDVAQDMNSSTSPTGTYMSEVFRSYPNNFIYSGYASSGSIINRGTDGEYWSGTARAINHAYYLSFDSTLVSMHESSGTKATGRIIRCIFAPQA